ncbi:hypothetical protein SAMN02983003_0688 [Devosia enhydra]|uniref:Uncharacterized protein n=1 Tax=Devosia enhydra TaxID=665118 RepID=A0A1K2HVH4_9HYPH|nr:hypothetical protein [Devosia enhydra]SFZ81781.1 hypothetical protein SAMN02983003_0688 [Devosia enhydra]
MKPVLFPSNEAQGLSLRKSLRLLVALRRKLMGSVGYASGWARAAAYVSRLLDGEAMTTTTVMRRAEQIGLMVGVDMSFGMILRATDEVSASIIKISAEQIGSDVGLTQAERTAIGDRRMRWLDAKDENKVARAKRLKRESEARRRAQQGATPRSQSMAATKPWEALNISESTYRRRKRMTGIRGAGESIEETQLHEKRSRPGKLHEKRSTERVSHASSRP